MVDMYSVLETGTGSCGLAEFGAFMMRALPTGVKKGVRESS